MVKEGIHVCCVSPYKVKIWQTQESSSNKPNIWSQLLQRRREFEAKTHRLVSYWREARIDFWRAERIVLTWNAKIQIYWLLAVRMSKQEVLHHLTGVAISNYLASSNPVLCIFFCPYQLSSCTYTKSIHLLFGQGLRILWKIIALASQKMLSLVYYLGKYQNFTTTSEELNNL